MHVYGIVAEWNPFHNGHLHLIQAIRSYDGDACIVSAMSGPFCQRGQAALMDKWQRARAALAGGVDLVIELPQAGASASLETFARAGVAQLLALAPLDGLFCGSESADEALIKAQADHLRSHKQEFDRHMRLATASGRPYAAAAQDFLIHAGLAGQDSRLHPNDRLALHYRLHLPSDIPLHMVARTAGHDANGLGAFAGGSWIRQEWAAGRDIRPFVPQTTLTLLQAQGTRADESRLFSALQVWAASHSAQDLAEALSIRDGWQDRFYEALCQARDMQDLLQRAQTRAYGQARLHRMILQLLSPLPPCPHTMPYVRVLGARDRGRALLKARKDSAVIVNRPARMRDALPPQAQALLDADIRRQNLFDLLTLGQMTFRDYSTPPVMV